jgi:nitroreductase
MHNHMQLTHAIHTRRSIRHYTSQPVSDQQVETILRAGMAAPSAGNEQPWHFLVIRDRKTLTALSESHPYGAMIQEAPVAIMVCGDMTRVKHKDYWPQDLAAATQNMLLTAHDLGLGSVWVGVYPRESRQADVKRVVTVPENIVPFSILPIGYPAEEKPAEERFDLTRIRQT